MTTLRLRVRQLGRLASMRGIEIESIEQSATVSAVPGCQFGMALVRGQIIPVLRLGASEGCLVVGRVRGEVLGIVGLDIVGFDLVDSAEERTLADVADDPSAEDTSALVSDQVCDADGVCELDIEQWIAKTKLQSRHPMWPPEESA